MPTADSWAEGSWAGPPFLGLESEAETTGEKRNSGKKKEKDTFRQERRQERGITMGLEVMWLDGARWSG